MDIQDTTLKQDKQVTVDVPEDRLAEFYAFYSRFLAVGSDARGRGHSRGGHHGGSHHGPGHRGGHRCGGRESGRAEHAAGVAAPSTGTSDAPGTDAAAVA